MIHKNNDYNSIAYRKKLMEKRNTFVSSILFAGMIFSSVSFLSTVNYELKHENPFDGNNIKQNQLISLAQTYDVTKYLNDSDFIETIKIIKSMSKNDKKAFSLYFAILTNDFFTNDEKKAFQTYIKYAADNTYLDYEKIYNIFSNLVIERNVDFVQEYGSEYNTSSYAGLADRENNKIQLLSNKSGDQALFHELCHMDNEDLPLWFNEGITDLISYEYNSTSGSEYDFHKNVIRILCEILGVEKGSDTMFKIEATGDFNILTDELKKLGIDEKLINDLYTRLESYHNKHNFFHFSNDEYYDIDGNQIDEEKYEMQMILSDLAVMYDVANDHSQEVDNKILYLFTNPHLDPKTDKVYYLNNELKKQYPSYVNISYCYPLELFETRKVNEISSFGNIKSISHVFPIDDVKYIEIYESEFDKCDKDKIVKMCGNLEQDEYVTYIISGDSKREFFRRKVNMDTYNKLLELNNHKSKFY